jgi:RHS repeat-associated protein
MLRANVDRNLPTRPVLHGWRLAIGGVLCAGLTAGLVSPAWASDGDDGAPAIELGSFSLGDGLEGTIGDLDGAFTFALPVGGLQLSWDSRVAGSDLQGLGDGWTFGIPSVQLTGGVRVFPASGGSYAADRSAPTGLAGYPSADIRFEVADGDAVVPARPDGVVDARPYAYALHELGGASTYFDDLGRPIGEISAEGTTIDTSYWADGTRRDLVTGAGSTRYYWAGATLLTEVHASTDGTGGAGGTASYLLGTARHARVVQPEGGAASAAYYGTDRHGNVTDLTDELGAVTTEYAYSDYGVATVTGEAADAGATGVGELTYNPYQYASEYTSRDGTQFLGERMYEPSTARFREKDRESLANKFAFANLNPIMNVDPSGRSAESDRLSVGLTLGGFVLSLVGAGLLIASGGTALAGIGAVAGVFAAADVTLAGVEVANMLSDVKFMDEKATEIASWTLFAAGAVFAIGGAIAKYAKRGAKVLDASEQISTQTPSTPVTRRQVIVQDVPEQPGKAMADDIIEDEGVRTWSDADQALMDEYVSMQEQLADIDDWLRLNQRAVSDLRGAAFDATNVNLRQDHLRRTNALGKVDMAVTALGEAWTAGAKALLTPLSNTAPLAKSLALLRGQRNLVLGYLGVARAQLGQAAELLAPTISNATVATAHTRVTAVGASLAKLLPAF